MRKTSAQIQSNICRMYREGKSSLDISKRTGITAKGVLGICRKNGLKIRASKSYYRHITDSLKKKMIDQYIAGDTTVSISRRYGFHQTTVHDMLRKSGTQMRSLSEAKTKVTISPDLCDKMVAEYTSGSSTLDLQKLYDIDNATIGKMLKQRGVTLRTISQAHKLAHRKGKFRVAHEQGKHSSRIENSFLSFVERKHNIQFERNQFGKRIYFAGGYYFDAKYKDIIFEVDGTVHRFNRKEEWYNYHKRLQAADDVGCRVVRIPLRWESKNTFNRAYQLIAPYLS